MLNSSQNAFNGSVATLDSGTVGYRSTITQPLPSHVTVRHAEPGDIDAIHAMLHCPSVLYWTVDLPFARVEDTYQQLLQQNGGYVLVACDRASVIGVLRLSILPNPRLQHTGRLGSLAVHPNHQGKGAGSALFKAVLDLADNWLNLRRLELLVYADNQAAIGLYQKYGFETEGTLCDFAFRAGRYVDGLIMARLPRSASPTT